MKHIGLCLLCLLWSQLHAADDQTSIETMWVIALDASGSMKERMHGSTRMQVAQQALHTVSKQLDSNTQVGLYVFGGGQNTGWLYPLGPLDPAQLTAATNRAKPQGSTPLGKTLVQCGNALLSNVKNNLAMAPIAYWWSPMVKPVTGHHGTRNPAGLSSWYHPRCYWPRHGPSPQPRHQSPQLSPRR